ncbi:MAG: hypothetical protein QOI63_1643, partial [Thermoplasmata archaeon]|nr:hypothetical protein [Thermoplasmata archaeon]
MTDLDLLPSSKKVCVNTGRVRMGSFAHR